MGIEQDCASVVPSGVKRLAEASSPSLTIGENELQVELAEGVRVRIIKQTITDILTRGESVRGAKEGDEDEKPMLPQPKAGAVPERKSLLGNLFGKK